MKRGLSLVTGGAGFIGSHVVDELLARGGPVRIADNLSTGSRANIDRLGGKAEFLEGDLTERDFARAACEGAEVVFHLAALPSVPVSMERPEDSVRHGVMATANVLAAAKDAGARRVIYSSSSSVYGGLGPFPQKETAEPAPMNPYAASKLCGEVCVRSFSRAFGLDAVSLRYFNVFGPRQPLKGPYSAVFPAFINRMLRDEMPVIHGDGGQSRDFTYVADVVMANMRAAEAVGPLHGEAVNVAAGRTTSLLDLVRLLNATLGTDIKPEHVDPRPGDVRMSMADVSLARELLGHGAEWTVERGLVPTVEHFKRESGCELR